MFLGRKIQRNPQATCTYVPCWGSSREVITEEELPPHLPCAGFLQAGKKKPIFKAPLEASFPGTIFLSRDTQY